MANCKARGKHSLVPTVSCAHRKIPYPSMYSLIPATTAIIIPPVHAQDPFRLERRISDPEVQHTDVCGVQGIVEPP